jgi:FkbM family methyltransferase
MKHLLFKFIIFFWKISPFKKTLSSLIKKQPRIMGKLYQDLRIKGKMNVSISKTSFQLFNPGNTTIENEIFWKGILGWEKTSMELWIELCKGANTILDIGANSGVFSIIASAVNPNSEIIAFEPVKRTTEIFKRNLDLNPDFKIKLIEKAVSNNAGKFMFYDVPTDTQYSASLNPQMLSSIENRISYEVDTITLDTFSEIKGKQIDLIKLDVEMHEPEAIEGMIELIKINKPTFLMEILTDEIANKIQKMFSEFDYLCYSIDEENKPKLLNEIGKSDFHNILLIDRNKIGTLKNYLN